jgi:hypothetical protein
MNYAQRHPGRFISAAQLDGDTTLTIAGVARQDLEKPDGSVKTETILSFKEALPLVLNATNDQCISAMFGEDDARWTGKRVTWRVEEDHSPVNDTGICLRVAGSPDIDKDVVVEIVLGRRRRPQKRTLTRTRAVAAPQPPQDGPQSASGPADDSAAAQGSGDDFDGLEEPVAADPIDAAQAKALRAAMKRLSITLEEWAELLSPYGVQSANSLDHAQAAELLALLDSQTAESWAGQRALAS